MALLRCNKIECKNQRSFLKAFETESNQIENEKSQELCPRVMYQWSRVILSITENNMTKEGPWERSPGRHDTMKTRI